MIPDQAHRLRKLVHRSADSAAPPREGAPRLIAVVGAKGGVGTTTVAVNLAIALAREGRRTLLVDADMQRADVAAQCALPDGYCLADVMSGRRTLHEAIRLGPAGVQILPGRWGANAADEWSVRTQDRLVRDLRALGPHADIVLLDVGATIAPPTRRFWRDADDVVLVTSPDRVAVMDAYAMIKAQFDASQDARVAILVNQASDAACGQDAQVRLQRACRRFLGLEARALGVLPYDVSVGVAATVVQPVLLHAPACVTAQEITRVAGWIVEAGRDRRRTAATMSLVAAGPAEYGASGTNPPSLPSAGPV